MDTNPYYIQINVIHFSFIHHWEQLYLICSDGSVWKLINDSFTANVVDQKKLPNRERMEGGVFLSCRFALVRKMQCFKVLKGHSIDFTHSLLVVRSTTQPSKTV